MLHLPTDAEQCEALLQLLWQNSVTGLALVSEEGKFLQANPAFCRLTEYTEAELKRRKFQDITEPSDIEPDEEMAKMVAQGEIQTYDMVKTYITKSRVFLPILLRVTGLRTREKFIYFVAEIAPLEKAPQVLPVQTAALKCAKRRALLSFIKDYWVQLSAGGAIAAAAVDKILSHWPMGKP